MVNRKLYCALLFISAIICLLCLFIPQSCPLFTIIAGTGCGGIASTMVAWLIDESSSKKVIEKASRNRKLLFDALFSSFSNGMQTLILYARHYVKDDSKRKWHEWIDCAHELSISNSDFRQIFIATLQVLFNEISSQIHGIQAQSNVLLEYETIDSNDSQAISLICITCDLVESGLKQAVYDEKIFYNLLTYCKTIEFALASSQSMRFVNNTPIDETLYDLSKKVIYEQEVI